LKLIYKKTFKNNLTKKNLKKHDFNRVPKQSSISLAKDTSARSHLDLTFLDLQVVVEE
jgi:hypothetical protein